MKAEDEDPRSTKSYPLICLLHLLGKILEQLICYRRKEVIENQEFATTRQCGFGAGRSAEDALTQIRITIEHSDKKYTLAILCDTTQAFDFMSWEFFITGLYRRNCSNNLIKLIRGFLTGRTVEITGTYNTHPKPVTRGCP